MRGGDAGGRRGAFLATLLMALAAALLSPAAIQSPAMAQEIDEYAEFVPDSVFQATPRAPVSYSSIYQRDQARGLWMQNVGYHRSVGRFSLNLDGGTSTSDDLQGIASKSSSGDISGTVRWRAASPLVFSVEGRYSMTSVSDGTRGSRTDQRRNRLALKSQYSWNPRESVGLQLLGSTEFRRNHDLRLVNRDLPGRPDDVNPNPPDSLQASRDSAYVSGRLDTARGQVRWSVTDALRFTGVASTSRMTTQSHWRLADDKIPASGTPVGSTKSSNERRPSDNMLLDGTIAYSGTRGATATLRSKRADTENVYFDLGRDSLEFFVSDVRNHSLVVQTGGMLPVVVNVTGTLNRSLSVSDTRASSSALITSREAAATVAYTRPATSAFATFTVNRTRADRVATTSDLTVSRIAAANVRQRLSRGLWVEGRGNATLYSYQYPIDPDDPVSQPDSEFSTLDRDVASAFGSLGIQFAITPRCSTAASFSASRTHDVSIDASRSTGNLATTVYQINGSIRMPLSRDITIGQDYVLTATYRLFDYAEERNDLSRNFRIDTSVTDTLLPVAYLKLIHRYTFFDRGDFTPIGPGGPRLYGVASEQFQHVLSGTVGIHPMPGVAFVATQGLADTRNHDLLASPNRRTTTQQWNLSLGLEVNRSFWDGASLIGAVRHEGKYQNLSTATGSVNREDHWIAGVTLQKDF